MAQDSGTTVTPLATGGIIPATHATLRADALLAEVARAYDLGPPRSCALHRAYANDVYRADLGAERYLVKVYRAGWRSPSEVAYEVALLAHLDRRGVAVAPALPRRDGGLVGTLRAPEGPRPYILFALAQGSHPVPPFTPDLYGRFGRATALMHRAAADFTTPHPRAPLDLAHFLDRPLAAVRPWLVDRPDDWRTLVAVAEAVRAHVAAHAVALDWGPCHGDLSLDNLHATATGDIILFDFDSGGPGWRAADPYGVYRYARGGPEDLWAAFLDGYRAVRPFGAREVAAVPYFAAAQALQHLGHRVVNWVAWGGAALAGPTYWDREMGALRRWARDEGLLTARSV